jgi:hypothetical protein
VRVAFLGYALWGTLKHLLKASASKLSPMQALALASNLHSADIVMPTTDGRQIRLRRVPKVAAVKSGAPVMCVEIRSWSN